MATVAEIKWDKEFMRPPSGAVGAAGRINGMGELDPNGSYVALFIDRASYKISVGAAQVLIAELKGCLRKAGAE